MARRWSWRWRRRWAVGGGRRQSTFHASWDRLPCGRVEPSRAESAGGREGGLSQPVGRSGLLTVPAQQPSSSSSSSRGSSGSRGRNSGLADSRSHESRTPQRPERCRRRASIKDGGKDGVYAAVRHTEPRPEWFSTDSEAGVAQCRLVELEPT